MKISIIGAGQVAYHFARQAFAMGHQVRQIYARQPQQAKHIADLVNATVIQQWHELQTDVDVIILAVKDSAIAEVMAQISPYLMQHHATALVVHTSGSTDLAVLQGEYVHTGVLYPLQTFSLQREINWQQTPLLLETSLQEDKAILEQFAYSLSQNIYHYSSKQRFSLHLSAVIACNFSNFCYDVAKQILDAEQVDFRLLSPLIMETTEKATLFSPETVQTGPARRQDHNILQRHQQALAEMQREDLVKLYQQLSEMIIQRANTL